LDHIDQQILEELKQNGRASAAWLGKKVALSVPAVLERIRKLTQSGIILGYSAHIDRSKLGYKLLAFIFVRLDSSAEICHFREAVVCFPQVLECHHIAGEYDYLLKVTVEDTAALEHFLTDTLKTIPGVTQTNTQIVLATLKEALNA